MKRKFLMVAAIVLIFGVGLLGGRGVSALLAWATTPAPITWGDQTALLQRADAERVLFTLSTCPYCLQARSWLNEHDVRFKELVVDTSPEAQRLFDEIKEKAVPVLVTRDQLIRGFTADAYLAALATPPRSAAASSGAR